MPDGLDLPRASAPHLSVHESSRASLPPLASVDCARLFLSLRVPQNVQQRLQQSLASYLQVIERQMPENQLHLTLLFLGEVANPQQYMSRLMKVMPQTFVPTVTLTHVGRGLERNRLWAYAHPSTILLNVREQLIARLRTMRFPFPKNIHRNFVPHITLAKLYPMAGGIGLADTACPLTYTVETVDLWRSIPRHGQAQYYGEGNISLTAINA